MNDVDLGQNRLVALAIKVHNQLRDWCLENFPIEGGPLPELTISGYYVAMAIGKIHVWDSESHYPMTQREADHPDYELCFEGCVLSYRLALTALLPPE